MADDWQTLRDRLKLQLRPIERWPGQMHRNRERSPFSASLGNTLALLTRELGMLNARNIVLQIAIAEGGFRQDGLPRAQAKAEHPGVILSFDSTHGPLSLPCDTYTSWQHNLRAIAMHLENLRHASLHGVGRHGEQYRGWKALPAGETESTPSQGMTLDAAAMTLSRLGGSAANPVQVRDSADHYAAALRRARTRCHPDVCSGSRENWDLLEQAREILDRHHGTAKVRAA